MRRRIPPAHVEVARTAPPLHRMRLGSRSASASSARCVDTVSSILLEAAAWLEARGMPMWRADELHPERLASDVGAGLFFLASVDGDAAGTIKFQLSDPEFWPDQLGDESAYLHRLAVRRQFAGRGVSSALLAWAVGRAAELGRRYLRLDCAAARPRLRAIYEDFGFEHHSDRQVGPYFVSRYQLTVARRGR